MFIQTTSIPCSLTSGHSLREANGAWSSTTGGISTTRVASLVGAICTTPALPSMLRAKNSPSASSVHWLTRPSSMSSNRKRRPCPNAISRFSSIPSSASPSIPLTAGCWMPTSKCVPSVTSTARLTMPSSRTTIFSTCSPSARCSTAITSPNIGVVRKVSFLSATSTNTWKSASIPFTTRQANWSISPLPRGMSPRSVSSICSRSRTRSRSRKPMRPSRFMRRSCAI